MLHDFIQLYFSSITSLPKAISKRMVKNDVFGDGVGQWRNDAPAALATPGGAVLRGRQIVIKMWDNFARLTAQLAKSTVLCNNSLFV